MSALPSNRDAELSVVAKMLTHPNAVPEVIGLQVDREDFFSPDTRLVYEAAVAAFYDGTATDPVAIGAKITPGLAGLWNCPPNEVTRKLFEISHQRASGNTLVDHSNLIRRHGDERKLLALMQQAQGAINDGSMTPGEVSNLISSGALKIATGTAKRGEIMSMKEVGEEYLKHLRRVTKARELGVEISAYFGYKFIDTWVRGLAPSELMIVGGEPGVGKSAITWAMATGFARRQMKRPEEERVGVLVLSLEMALIGSTGRIATSLSGVASEKQREGKLSPDELAHIGAAWKNEENLPIYWNFSSNFKMSQMRALIVEAIRRHNIGVVIVDHFRMFDPDRRINNSPQEDEAKARFLKEDLAKDLNIAVVCLAHTVKLNKEYGGGRPTLSELRGSGQVAAHSDVVAFMYRPSMYASENEINEGTINEDDAELLYRKNRNGGLGTADFTFRPSKMEVVDRWTT